MKVTYALVPLQRQRTPGRRIRPVNDSLAIAGELSDPSFYYASLSLGIYTVFLTGCR